jgi:hypothetical protein
MGVAQYWRGTAQLSGEHSWWTRLEFIYINPDAPTIVCKGANSGEASVRQLGFEETQRREERPKSMSDARNAD